MKNSASPLISDDLKAFLTVHHVSVDPQAVPSFHMTQSALTHLTLKTGSVAVDLHVLYNHLGLSSEGLTAVSAQVFLKHRSLRR